MMETTPTASRRGGRAFPSTGITSLVLVFVLLCLLTFAVLSLLSAQADLRLSEKSAARTTAWYEAENASTDVLIALRPILEENADAEDADAFYAAVQKQAAAQLEVTAPAVDRLAWQIPLGEQQILYAEIELCWPANTDGQYYRTVTWQAQNTYAWNAEQPLDLMRPDV